MLFADQFPDVLQNAARFCCEMINTGGMFCCGCFLLFLLLVFVAGDVLYSRLVYQRVGVFFFMQPFSCFQ